MVPKNIVLISDQKVLHLPIVENNDPLVDVRNFREIAVDSRKNEDSNSYFKLRQLVVAKLFEAAKYLPQGVRFLVIEGHRPLSLQKKYFDEYSYELEKLHLDWDKNKIYQEASKYIAPPEIIPPHSTGGAVDLTLIKEDGEELDMGTVLNVDPEKSDNACFTLAMNISQKAMDNRKILIDVMSKSGFVNYPTEWWHWSYGDRYWAYQTNSSCAIFNSIE